MDVGTGRALGSRYHLQDRLGSGAMGEVWRAVDRADGTLVAAKLLRSELTRDPQLVARFVQERSILLTLQHPHIVRVRDLVVEGEDLALVMDLVVGTDLGKDLAARGTLTPQEAARICGAVLQALSYAHQQHCLHRDVKPDNVLLGEEGQVLLTDFGIARLAQETSVRATGALGTPEYMAPEVFVAEVISPAADVYAAGVLLYELLAGRTPYAGGTNGYAVVNRHVTALPPALPGLPTALVDLLEAMLAKDPARRPSAEAAHRSLVALQPALIDLPALEAQPQPQTWTQVAGSIPVVDGPELDPGATTVRGLPGVEAVLPTADGSVLRPLEGLELGQTSVAAPRAPHQAPTLTPEVVAPPPTSGRRRVLLLSAGAVVVVAVLVAGVLLLGGSHGSTTPSAQPGQAGPVEATAAEERLPTGLTVSRSTTYDGRSGAVTARVTWTAGRTALAGPFYESVPVPAGSCQVAWDAAVPVTRTVLQTLAAPCGFTVAVGRLRPGQAASASYTVAAALKGDQALQSFVDKAATQTAAELAGKAGLNAFAAQRLDHVEVDVPVSVRTGSPVTVRLLPVWVGTSDPDPFALFDSSVVGRASGVLDQVAGGLGGVQLSAVSCGSALGVDRRLYPFTQQPATGCVIGARVGDLPDAESAPFDITYRSG